jgi:hypothetical protein
MLSQFISLTGFGSLILAYIYGISKSELALFDGIAPGMVVLLKHPTETGNCQTYNNSVSQLFNYLRSSPIRTWVSS